MASRPRIIRPTSGHQTVRPTDAEGGVDRLFETAFHQFAPKGDALRGAGSVGADRHPALGFHGASHKFIAERSAELLDRPDVRNAARQLYVKRRRDKKLPAPAARDLCHLAAVRASREF